MKIIYYGHAAFQIDDLIIDPFLSGNPHCRTRPEDVTCSVICVTHDHEDHIGDAIDIAKRNNATIVGIHEIDVMCRGKDVKSIGMNFSGTIDINGWKITMVEAWHSSYSGMPCGYIIEKGGRILYHAGDTGLFGDMKLIGEMYHPEIGFIPIGGHYTMGIKEAVKACELLGIKTAIPMHYNTFPVIQADPNEFKEKAPCEVIVMEPNTTIEV